MSLTLVSPTRSSWIRAIGYLHAPDGHTYLGIFADSFAWLVTDVPSTVPGLLAAGHVAAKDDGELSIGAAVHRLVLQKKSEYPRQKVEGKEMWRLRGLMKKETPKCGKFVRTKYLDCDNRRTPKTDLFCCCCNKDIKPESIYRFVHWIDGGPFILHPKDKAIYISDRGDMGLFPIGMSCARRLGLEWTHAK